MSHEQRQDSGEQGVKERNELVTMKDFGKLNSFPRLATIFRKPGNKSRIGGKIYSESEDVYIHSMAVVTDAVAEEVRFNAQGRRTIVKQQKFLIPLEYEGWFEVLSQDGRSTRPIETVKALSGLVKSSLFLVRQSVSGYKLNGDGVYAAEICKEGQVLSVQETVQSLARKSASDTDITKGPLLKCLDKQGSQLYLSLDATGLFSPIACRSSIIGAHDIRSLLEKFRLPVLVRLIHGNISKTDGVQPAGRSPKIFRLQGKYSEEVAFVLLLNPKLSGKDACDMLPLPANDKYVISRPETKTWQSVSVGLTDDDGIKCLGKRCDLLISYYKSAIRHFPSHRRHWLVTDKALDMDHIERNKQNVPLDNTSHLLSPEEQQLFREIEDLYADVRNPRHLLTPPKLQLQRQGLTEAVENANFPKSFRMVAFSNGALAGRPVLFSRNPVFHGNFDKLNTKQTRGGKADHVPLMTANRRYGNKNGKNDNRLEAMNQSLGAMKSACSSKENLYEEIDFLKPNMTDRLPRLTGETLHKHKLEMFNISKSTETLTDKYSNTQLTSTRQNGLGEKHQNKSIQSLFNQGSSNPTNRTPRGQASSNKDTTDNAQHSVDRDKFTDTDGNNGPFQRDSYGQTSFRIEQTWNTRPSLLRPKSYAGTPHNDHQLTAFLGPTIAPPIPPKRVASLTEINVLSELPHRNELTVSSYNHLNQDKRRMSTSTTTLPVYRESNPSLSSEFNRNKPTNRTVGNVPQSVVNTIRRMGNKSTTFVVNSENRPISSKDADAMIRKQRLRIRSANDDTFPSYV